MKFEINITKKHLYYALGFVVFVFIVGIAMAQTAVNNPGHPAEQIDEGTIAGTLTVSGGNVGIGTTSPAYALEVETAATTSFGLMSGTGITGLVIEGTAQGLLTFDNQNGEIMQMQLNRDVAFTGGNVGIGTTAPTAGLSIRSDASNAAIDFNRGGTKYGFVGVNTVNEMTIQADDVPLKFSADGGVSNHMRILANGNVGIGTTSPAVKLDVYAAGGVAATQQIVALESTRAGATDGTYIGIYDNTGGVRHTNSNIASVNGNLAFQTISGNVGIGTTSPTAALYVQPSSSEDEALQLRPKSGLSGYTLTFLLDDTAAYITHNSALRKFILGANNLNTLTMDASGNVGIGTTSPSAKLEVVGANSKFQLTDTGFLYGGYNGAGSFSITPGSWSNGNLILNAAGSGNIILGNSVGNVGIGTASPQYKLSLGSTNDKIGYYNDATHYAYIQLYNPTTGNMEIKSDTGGTSHLLLNPEGNVGIGVTDPVAKLHVAGVVKATAFNTGDIVFNKDDKPVWRMFEDEEGLYLESLKTGETYRFLLQKIE